MAESSSTSNAGQEAQNVEKGDFEASLAYEKLPEGRKINFKASTTNIRVAKELCKLAGFVAAGTVAISLAALYGYAKIQPLLYEAINKTFGAENVEKIIPNCLQVLIRCSTDEIFLKILKDYELKRLTKRLKDAFGAVGIEVEGLKVEIENIEEVKNAKEEITKRRKTETMTDDEKKTTTEIDSRAESTGEYEGSQIDKPSKEHRNWLTVGELIGSIQKPIATYVYAIVKALYNKLSEDLGSIGKCKTPQDCHYARYFRNLCSTCSKWFSALKAYCKNPTFNKIFKHARWSEDPWQMAKFFMPTFGHNGCESPDLSSLFAMLEMMRADAFQKIPQIDLNLVKALRSDVRNTWAHASKQECGDNEKSKSFSIATEFLDDLEKKFPHEENRDCKKFLAKLKNDGVTNIFESELRSLLLLRGELDEIKEDIATMKLERSSDKNEIEKNKKRLDDLELRYKEWSERSSNINYNISKLEFNVFHGPTYNIQQVNIQQVKQKLAALPAIPDVLNQIGQIRDQSFNINQREKECRESTSSLPVPVPKFTGRETEIRNVISLLIDEGKDVVSLHGGPGFGKSAIAIEVSHKLSDDQDITVFFSQLNTATTVDEMVRQLCRDEGVDYERDDPKSSLVLWLKSVQGKVIIVMDDVDNLLEDKNRDDFDNFIKLLRKNQNCQIVTTSRSSYSISTLSFGMVDVKEMDDEACIELLREQCCVQDEVSLQKLAKLCGHIPLAMCVAAPQIGNPEEFEEFCHDLKDEPFEILEDCKSNRNVYRDINMSYEKLGDQQKKILVRLPAFDESFSVDDASNVIKKGKFVTKRNLESLVCQSLIKQPTEHQYSINFLIKHFLKKQNDD